MAPSRDTLVRQEEYTRDQLLDRVSSLEIDDTVPVQDLIRTGREIKQLIANYEEASKHLSKWYSDQPCPTQATETRNCRIKIVHGDCREVIRNINSAITQRGGDTVSSVGAESVFEGWSSRRQSLPNHGSPLQLPADRDSLHQSLADRGASHQLPADHDSPHRPRAGSGGDWENVNAPNPNLNLLDISLNVPSRPVQMIANKVESSVTSDHQDFEPLDPVSRRQLRHDLMKGLGDSFGGEPHQFWCWQQQLSRRLLEAEAGALDSMYIIQANTSGRVRSIVTNHLAAGAANPTEALARVWKDLKKRFGSNTLVSNSLLSKLTSYQSIRHVSQLTQMEDLRDLCAVIYANMDHCSELKFLDLQRGMRLVWEKLPEAFQLRWRKKWYNHEMKTGVSPCFANFLDFFNTYLDEISIPGFAVQPAHFNIGKNYSKTLASHVEPTCLYHNYAGHDLLNCFEFGKLPYEHRKRFAMDNKLCFNCLGGHRRINCRLTTLCGECGGKHLPLMHPDRPYYQHQRDPLPATVNQESTSEAGEQTQPPIPEATARCISVCGDVKRTKVCSKTLMVQVRGPGNKSIRCYCIVDEQSNASFCDPKLREYFGLTGTTQSYNLKTMAGLKTVMACTSLEGLEVRGIFENKWIPLPPLITNPHIPASQDEVATPAIVSSHPHIRNFAKYFPQPEIDCEVLLLVGADCGQAMKTTCYGSTYPYVHHTALGWSLVGPVCEKPVYPLSYKCFRTRAVVLHEHLTATPTFEAAAKTVPLMRDVFFESVDDDFSGPSREDRKFMELMASSITTNDHGRLEMPLPLRESCKLVNNKEAVFTRTCNTLGRLRKDTATCREALDIMAGYLQDHHVEELPLGEGGYSELINYVPIFPIKQEGKSKIRLVFDSSACYGGTSLNDHLLQGPDENNHLTGVLTRFRHGSVGFAADIQCMFHNFFVAREHCDLLRFFWWANNDPSEEITPYRARVHVFGNKCSPAVANFGLRYAANFNKNPDLQPSRSFILKNVYVDDALGSTEKPEKAIEILKGAREILSKFHIRLHKIVSNSEKVTEFFPATECKDANKIVDISQAPIHKTLGLAWRIADDTFVIKCRFLPRKFNRRGVLSTINALFDPLGMVGPIILQGRLLQRKFIPSKNKESKQPTGKDWDEPLPDEYLPVWQSWISSMAQACEIAIPRSFTVPEFGTITKRELHVFADASEEAIGHAIYLKSFNSQGRVCVSFVSGSSKVSPRAATSIPRLELCAAVEATSGAMIAGRDIDQKLDSTTFYTDSRVILGYIFNEERRFSKYVTTRVNLILKRSTSSQWQHVSTSENTGDIATRPHTPSTLLKSRWFAGPEFLTLGERVPSCEDKLDNVELPETLATVKTVRTDKKKNESIVNLICSRVSCWTRVTKITGYILKFCKKYCAKRNVFDDDSPVQLLIREVQKETFPEAYDCLLRGRQVLLGNSLASLDPYLDESNIMRVGGRLKLSNLLFEYKHPILLPPNHDLTTMILRHYHRRVQHQGRHLTLGALREAGYHIHKGSQVLRKFLSGCVICRKLRTLPECQKMSDLPRDRVEEAPPFTFVGVDCFGPYLVHDGRETRKTRATKKVWVVLFTCLSSRAVHLEPLCSLDITSFRLALQRFTSIRGQCKLIRSDNGTNLVGTRNQLHSSITEEDLQKTSEKIGCKWEFIPPGASHMGGAWERKIGAIKKVLNASIKLLNNRALSREEFCTLIQEAANIVNHTPLYEISSDPSDPFPVSPSMLLTLKDHSDPSPPETFEEADLMSYGKRRWRRVCYLSDQFWKRWRSNYVNTLQDRRKWIRPRRNLRVNDIVLLRTSSTRNQWPMGRISSVENGSDNVVRAVELYLPTTGKTLKRSIHDMVLLIPTSSDAVDVG